MPPELENLLKQVQIEGTLNAKDFVSSIFFTEDSDYVKEFRNDFKNKFIQPLSRQLKNFKPEDVRKIIDPFGISKDSDDLAEDFKKYRKKLKKFLAMDFPEMDDESPKEKLKDTTVSEALPDKVKEIEPATIEEQKTFGSKITTVNFDDSTKDFFKYIFKEISGYDYKSNEEWRKKQNEFSEKYLANQEQLIALSEGTGILGTLAKVLAIGGVGALLLSTFWESHIKPWMEETFDINLDFFDKFEGFIEAIGKFFTLGATGAGGLLLKIQGKVFTSIADVLDNSIGSVLKAIFGETGGGAVGKIASGGASLFSGSFLARLAGNLFKGLSIVALKSIPVIGGLISLGFAYDRFQKGDNIGAVIDLVGGLADLLYFTPLAPLGLAISLGAAGLNAFLDLKYGGTGDRAAESKAKLGFLGDISTSIYKTLIKIPVIGGMIEGVTGLWNLLYSLAGGDTGGTRKALEQMTKFPLLGALPSILLAFFDVTDSPSEQGNQMNLPNFLQSFKKRVGQTVLSWFSWLPTSWQKSIADFMGVPFEGSGEDETSDISNPQAHKSRMNQIKETDVNQENIDTVLKNRESAYKDYQEAISKRDEQDGFWGKVVTGKFETYEKMANNLADEFQVLNEKIRQYQEVNSSFTDKDYVEAVADSFNQVAEKMKRNREKSFGEDQTTKVEDFYKPASGKSTLIFDQNSNAKFQTAPNDDVLAMKPNGIFDKALKEIQMVAFDINKNIKNLNESITSNQKQTAPNVFNVNNAGGSGYTGKEYLMEGERDAIFNDRLKWIVYSQNLRATT
jgi:hypothetical protein